MTNDEKCQLLQNRLNKLESSEKDNFGVCRKIRRNIRNLKKKAE